jgi:membrane protein insertase Oxa1/YidC/SpoIIIJ
LGKPLEPQIEELKAKLQKDYDEATTELNKLLQQLEEFKAEGDGE